MITHCVNTLLKKFAYLSLFLLAIFLKSPTQVLAQQSPPGCTGSGLGINLFTSSTQVRIGDTIFFSVLVFNGSGVTPVVCDATEISASIVTPDGVTHPITLTRTALSHGESDFYSNVVSYVARAVDVQPDNTLKATASDTGIIHQNDVGSQGGGNQGLNVYIINDFHVIKNVINDNGGTKVAADFSIHVMNGDTDVPGSPAGGEGAPGTLYPIILGTYGVSVIEDPTTTYTHTYSGDCDENGNTTLAVGDNKTCTITNNDISTTPTPTPTNPPSSDNPLPPPSNPPPGAPPVCTSTGVNAIPTIILARRQSPTSIFVLTWAPDRLSRNAGDLGMLVDLMDQGRLHQIKTFDDSLFPSKTGERQ